MGWWVMPDINDLMTRYYAQAQGQSQDQQLKWWNSLTYTEHGLLVDHVSEILNQFLPAMEVLSVAFADLGNVIVDWYDSLEPEVKQVMKDIADGKGIDALRK